MKSRRRKGMLFGVATVLVAIVLAGWLVLAGRVDWLARFAKPRIQEALRESKVETEELDIAGLSLNGGRVGHAKANFEGGSVEVTGMEVELGLGKIRAGRAGAIRIDRVDMKLDPGLLDAIGASDTAADSIELPFDSIDIKEWHLDWVLNEVPITATGTLKADPGPDGVVAFSGKIAVDKATGSFSGTYSSAAAKLQMQVEAGQIPPEVVLAILRAFPRTADLGGVTFGWEGAKGTAQFTISKGEPASAHGEVTFADFVVSRQDQRGSFGTATVKVDWKESGSPVVDLDAGAVSAVAFGAALTATSMQFVGNTDGGSVSIGNVSANLGSLAVQGHGLAAVSLDANKALAAKGTWILDSASIGGIRAGQAELAFEWKDDGILAEAPSIDVSGGVEAAISNFHVQVGGLSGGFPTLSGNANVTLDPASFAKEGLSVLSGKETFGATFSGLLAKGSESVRLEYRLPGRDRLLEVKGTRIGGTGGLDGVVTIDPNHISGSIAGEWTNLGVLGAAGESIAFPSVKFRLSTGRVWIDAVRAWADIPPERILRELLWVTNVDVRASGGAVDLGEHGKAKGVDVTLLSNGADISERAGGSLAFSSKDYQVAGHAFVDIGGSLNFGLEGGTVKGGLALAEPHVPIRGQADASWAGRFSMSGTYAIDGLDLGKSGSWDGIADAFKGMTTDGSLSATGNWGMDSNGFSADAHVELASVRLEWPDKNLSLDGISGKIDLDSLRPLRAGPGQKVNVSGAKLVSLEVGKGTLEFGIPEPDRIAISRFEAATLGGRVSALPFSFDLFDPKPSARLRLDGIRLEQLMTFFPDVPATAEGAIVGELPVAWDGSNVSFGTGFIDLQPGELGRVHFNYDIRVLTEGKDSNSVIYPVLRRVEKAIRDLYFNRLRIDLYPADTPGRSAKIKIVGVTSESDVHAPVDLDINVDAPLDRFLKWGVNPAQP